MKRGAGLGYSRQPMDLAQFVPRLPLPLPGPNGPLDTTSALRAIDAAVRIDAPPGLPELDLPAALWAAASLQAACAHLDPVARASVTCSLPPCPSDPLAPATHYSVDLVLRHLPALLAKARAAAIATVELAPWLELAHAWPLSSVGVPGLGPVDAAPLLCNEGLRRLYLDRILRLDDRPRAADPVTAAALAELVAEHRAFARGVLAVHDVVVRDPDRIPRPR
jgi:MoxR-vWA-beta-propeller ternary system domain bpX4